jgi:hypothetical protein
MADEADEAIDEFLEGKPRASELAQMVAALEGRRETYQREMETAVEARKKEWASRIREVDNQIRILREEQAITGFVEDQIRASVNRPSPLWYGDDEDPER